MHESHGGKVPESMDELLQLPGVGPKMAIIVLRVAFDLTVGISVDTHVHRICNLLGWVGKADPKRTPEHTRAALESWVPRDLWADFNIMFVGLGQEIQTEQRKLVRKCTESSDPELALELIQRCGMDSKRIAQFLPTEHGA